MPNYKPGHDSIAKSSFNKPTKLTTFTTTRKNRSISNVFDEDRALEIFGKFSNTYLNKVCKEDENSQEQNKNEYFCFFFLVKEGRIDKLIKIAKDIYPKVKLLIPKIQLDEYLFAFIFYYASITHLLEANGFRNLTTTDVALLCYKFIYYSYQNPTCNQSEMMQTDNFKLMLRNINEILLELTKFDIVERFQEIYGGKKTKKNRKTRKTRKTKKNRKTRKSIKSKK